MVLKQWFARLRERRRQKLIAAETRQAGMTIDTMAIVLDKAFGAWVATGHEVDGLRSTPRIAVDGLPPLPVTGYAYAGELVELHEEGRIVDVSADGIRIAMSQAMPVGAIAYFALRCDGGEVQFGTAVVARCDAASDGFDLGLRFSGDADSIDVFEPRSTCGVRLGEYRRWVFIARKARECLNHGIAILSNQVPASVLLTEEHQGNHASFLVTAKLFRYGAVLHVNGRRVAGERGALHDRLYNLISSRARPTLLNLSGEGFSACATLRPNGVTAFSLRPIVELSSGGDHLSPEAAESRTNPPECRRSVDSPVARQREQVGVP